MKDYEKIIEEYEIIEDNARDIAKNCAALKRKLITNYNKGKKGTVLYYENNRDDCSLYEDVSCYVEDLTCNQIEIKWEIYMGCGSYDTSYERFPLEYLGMSEKEYLADYKRTITQKLDEYHSKRMPRLKDIEREEKKQLEYLQAKYKEGK